MTQPERKRKLFSQFASLIRPGQTVVDLGAGSGWFAKKMAENGASAIAVERNAPPELPAGVEWKTGTIEHWLGTLPPDFRADGFLLKNSIQFLDKQWTLDVLLPQLAAHLNAGGVIGIITFSAPPEPPFGKGRLSLYVTDELAAALPNTETLRKEDFTEVGPDMKGVTRTFHLAELIVRKPS